MNILLWDASGLAKRYAPEIGSNTADALFERTSVVSVSSAVGFAEIYSILLRKYNRGIINRDAHMRAKSNLRAEMIDNPSFLLLPISDDAFFAGVGLMEIYNINATDAALLVVFQAYIREASSDSKLKFVLVASDERLLRAAQGEGIATVNPEAIDANSVAAVLAAL